jgi:hypothetical protein
MSQYFKEAYGYRKGGLCGHNKFYHMVNMIKLDLPEFQFTSRGYINSNSLRVLYALCTYDDLAIAGSASVSKTYPVASYLLEDWKSAPHATLTFACTTSLGASEDRIWGAIVKQWKSSKYPVGSLLPHKNIIAYGKYSDSASDRDFNAAIKALAIPQGSEGEKAIDTLRGRKQLNVRLVYDELPEMERYVSRGTVNLESNLADQQINAFGLQVIGIGNPNDPNDAHGDMCRPASALGFEAVSKDVPEWETRTGHCIFLNGEWSPNFEAPPDEPIPFPRLTNRKVLARMLERCHGNYNALDYWRNAIGYWPNATILRTVLTKDLIISHKCLDKPFWLEKKRKRVCGFDTGFTAFGDKCVAHFGELGLDDSHRTILAHLIEKVYHAEMSGPFEDSIAKQVVDDCIKYGVEPDGFGMDISSDGGKMLTSIIRYWIGKNPKATEVVPLSSLEAASERIVSTTDPRRCNEVYDRRVTEYWLMAREAVVNEVIKDFPLYSDDGKSISDVADQLCSRIVMVKGYKQSIEPKPKYRERTAKDSPDNADSFVYLIEMARRHGLVFTSPTDVERQRKRKERQSRLDKMSSPEYNYSSDSWGEEEEEVKESLVNEDQDDWRIN